MNYLQLDETALNRHGALWTAREIAQQPQIWSERRNFYASMPR